MDFFNNDKNRFKVLKDKVNNLLFTTQYSENQLKDFIEKLDEIIILTEKNSQFSNLIEIRQFYLDRANCYLYLNNYSAALNNYEIAKSKINSNESDNELHYLKCMEGISWTKARMVRYSDSLKVCHELITYALPRKLLLSKFFTVKGACYKELGNKLLAERSFEFANANPVILYAAINEEGDDSLPNGFTAIGYNAMGNRCLKHGLLNEAISNYNKAIEINPLYTNAIFNKGVVLAEMDNHNDSIRMYTACLNIDPNYANAYFNRGVSKFNLGMNSSAKADFLEAGRLGVNQAYEILRSHF